MPFKINCLIEIPAGVFCKRSGYTLLSDQRLHRQLSDDGRSAGANEWYFDLNHILNVLYSLYTEFFETIQTADKWGIYISQKNLQYVKVVGEKEIKSKLYDGIMYDTQNTRSKRI